MDTNKLEKIASELHKMNFNLEKIVEQLKKSNDKLFGKKDACQIKEGYVLGCVPEIGSTGDKACSCGENCGCVKHSNK